MKQLLFFLLISAAVQGQVDTAKPRITFPVNSVKTWYYVDSVERHNLRFDTIPGAMQVIFWKKPWGCLDCEDFQTFWTGGYEVKSWYAQGSAGYRIYDKTYYLQSDKEPMPEGVTVALFVKRPQR